MYTHIYDHLENVLFKETKYSVEFTDDSQIITVEVPGCNKSNSKVQVVGSVLKFIDESNKHSSKFTIPSTVDKTKIKAKILDGILTVTLPYKKKSSFDIEIE